MTALARLTSLAGAATVLAVLAPAGGAALPRVPFCRVYLDPHDKHTRVAPLQTGTGASLTADAALSSITVEYGTGFTPQAQTAFQAAVDLWKTQVSSSVPMVIKADFLALDSTGALLGQAGPTCAFVNFQGNTRADTWFITAIANRLHGVDMTPAGSCASEEIAAQFNSVASWYYGTDGLTPTGDVDFESVVLHELGHGLGFIGAATVSSGLGTVGQQGYPYIYDANVSDGAGVSVLDTSAYPANSDVLGSLLKSNALYWNGAKGVSANGAAGRPKLYAPSLFTSGSSYSHLDESTYAAGDMNSLMTPQIGYSEAIHTPGPIVLGMFSDMGWGTQCNVGLDQTTASVQAAGGAVKVYVSAAAGCGWVSSANVAWVTGTGGGTSTGTLALTVAANTSTSARTGTVTVADQTLTIVQAGTNSSSCSFALSAAGATVGPSPAAGTVDLTTSTGCSWTATSSNAGIATITTGLTGQGPATIGYSVAGNTGGAPRTATLTIAGQSFVIAQAGCTYTLGSSSASISGAGGTLSVSVSAASACTWTASTSSPFMTIASGETGTGNGTVQFAVAANTSAQGRTTTATIAGQTFTLSQGAALPVMSFDRSSLVFGGVTNGAVFTAQTSTQVVRLLQAGSGTVTWTAQPNQPWVTVTPDSGTGSASISIGVQFATGLTPTQSASVTFTLSGAGNTLAPVDVTLNVVQNGTSGAPVGSFDTPIDGSTGIAGSIGVTGWAIDDVEVSTVAICRDAATGETPGIDARCNNLSKVFIGNAVFIDGARPDVQGKFPAVPRNTRAGWGYLMLTNFLPAGGNGTFTLHAYASDVDGHTAELGTGRRISCSNAQAVKPFGAIDTPAQGEIVSGVIANSGWALTQSGNDVPADSSTIQVFIDGTVVGRPGPRAARADISAFFPSSDTSHAVGGYIFDTTAFANGVHSISWIVSDTSGHQDGIGSRFFTISNGAQALAADGVSASDVFAGAATADGTSKEVPYGAVPYGAVRDGSGARSTVVESRAALDVPHAVAMRLSDAVALADEVDAAPPDASDVLGRRGFDLSAPLQRYVVTNGSVLVHAEELDRIELHITGTPGQAIAGFLRTPSGLAPLPVGSYLYASTGTFTWQPGPGFVGAYDLVFVRWSRGHAVARQDVRIFLDPKGSNRVGVQTIIDLPAEAGSHNVGLEAGSHNVGPEAGSHNVGPEAGSHNVGTGSHGGGGVASTFRWKEPILVTGWAADLDAVSDAGVDTVHVWAYPVRGSSRRSNEGAEAQYDAPIFLGAATHGGARPDVGAIYGARFTNSGYGLIVSDLPPGTYDLAVFAYSTVRNRFADAKVVRITIE